MEFIFILFSKPKSFDEMAIKIKYKNDKKLHQYYMHTYKRNEKFANLQNLICMNLKKK